MQATVIEKEDDWIGVKIVDNNDAEHKIAINKEGGIRGHSQDSYPDDPAERTPAGIEHVSQARRYAQYYVHHDQGYDTLPVGRDPEQIEAVRQALDNLDTDDFPDIFGDYYQQFASHYTGSEPVIEPPIDLDVNFSGGVDGLKQLGKDGLRQLLTGRDTENLYYRQTIYLTADESPEIDAVGEIHALYEQGGEEFETDHNELDDRVWDARLELAPAPPESYSQFQDYLIYHLACQIRDCYLTMGVAPPEQYRITGVGFVDALRRYAAFGVYEPYHDSDAEISTWQDEHTPQDLLV